MYLIRAGVLTSDTGSSGGLLCTLSGLDNLQVTLGPVEVCCVPYQGWSTYK